MRAQLGWALVGALIWWAVSWPATAAGRGPEFAMQDLDGRVHRLSDYSGKWVVVNYWATSCPPCRAEIPELRRFHERHKDTDAVVLGVHFERIRPDWLRAFVRSVDMSYPVIPSSPARVTPFGPVTVLPTTFLVSPAGEVVARQVGTVTGEALDSYIARHPETARRSADTPRD